MSRTHKIRKGVSIKLVGEAQKNLGKPFNIDTYAVKPPDFHGVIPKLLIKEGAEVKAGTPLFRDKFNENVMFCSPVSGEVTDVVRGEKRRILEVRILPDKENRFEEFGSINLDSIKTDELKSTLLKAGIWPLVQQRPFSTIADPKDEPKAIFVSGFDSSPLAPDEDFVIKGKGDLFQSGINALKVLANGKPVHLGVREGSEAYSNVSGAEKHAFSGPHPAGNVGVQIHHVDPINKGEVIWYVNYQDVINMGRFVKTGHHELMRTVALTGSGVSNPSYYEIPVGANVKHLIATEASTEDHRIISGNVLTGSQMPVDGYMGYYDSQITVIPEGDDPLFFLTKGWLGPGFDRFSISRAFPSWLMPNKKYDLTTNPNGEKRAYVVTGQYEKVFPFDIYPVHLVKSIMVNDIEQMEKLGIYEVGPEDFALCEYVCTSKIPVQSIVREGLDVIMEEFK